MPTSIRVNNKAYKRLQAIKHYLEKEKGSTVPMSTVIEYLLKNNVR